LDLGRCDHYQDVAVAPDTRFDQANE